MNSQDHKRVFPQILTACCSALSNSHIAFLSYVMGISPREAATLLAQGDTPTVDRQDFPEQAAQRSTHKDGHFYQEE
jgi:hypothetical protein